MSDTGDWTPELTIVGSKITGYLLNLDHRVGRHKAAWFIARGFQVNFDMPLTAELFRHGRPSHLVKDYATEHGRRYVYEGPLECPDGTKPAVRSVWQTTGSDERRFFVTAYPINAKP